MEEEAVVKLHRAKCENCGKVFESNLGYIHHKCIPEETESPFLSTEAFNLGWMTALDKNTSTAYDPVEKPAGYNQGTIECSDYIKDQSLDFFEGNVVKYVVRHKVKNGLEDLKKAKWYLNYMIEHYDGK